MAPHRVHSPLFDEPPSPEHTAEKSPLQCTVSVRTNPPLPPTLAQPNTLLNNFATEQQLPVAGVSSSRSFPRAVSEQADTRDEPPPPPLPQLTPAEFKRHVSEFDASVLENRKTIVRLLQQQVHASTNYRQTVCALTETSLAHLERARRDYLHRKSEFEPALARRPLKDSTDAYQCALDTVRQEIPAPQVAVAVQHTLAQMDAAYRQLFDLNRLLTQQLNAVGAALTAAEYKTIDFGGKEPDQANADSITVDRDPYLLAELEN